MPPVCLTWVFLQVTCRYPVFVDCCPVCTDCLYLGTRYQNGETFLSKDGCSQCMCRHGEVQCDDPLTCSSVTCSDPVRSNCCKHCTDCQYKVCLFYWIYWLNILHWYFDDGFYITSNKYTSLLNHPWNMLICASVIHLKPFQTSDWFIILNSYTRY